MPGRLRGARSERPQQLAEDPWHYVVWAANWSGAPELALPLGVTGWHDIYLGICYTDQQLGLHQEVGVKLSGDGASVGFRRR